MLSTSDGVRLPTEGEIFQSNIMSLRRPKCHHQVKEHREKGNSKTLNNGR